MYGYWKHWFAPFRQTTIVEFLGQTVFSRPLIAMEIARTFRQFSYIQLLKTITLSDGLDIPAEQLASSFEIRDLAWLDTVSETSNDDPSALLDHEAFRADPPHYCFEDDTLYPGDFPRPGIENDPQRLAMTCGYEIHSRFGHGQPDPNRYRESVSKLPSSPVWLRESSQREVFERLLAASDIQGAWMSLNSIGWRFRDARVAIASLAEKVGDEVFTHFSEAWSSLPHEERMGENY